MDFIKNIKDNSILLISNNLRYKILDYINENKLILDIKLMSFDELKEKLLYSYSNEAIYEIMNKYNVSYETACDFIKNTYYLNEENNNDKIKKLYNIKKHLEEKNLLIKDNLFIDLLKTKNNIYVYGYSYIDKFNKYLLDIASKYIKIEYIDTNKNDYKHVAHKLGTIEEEISYVAEEISKLLDQNININKIYISNYNDEYYFPIKKIFNLYKLPINLKSITNLSDTSIFKYFINNLSDDIELSLNQLKEKYDIDNNIENAKIYNKICKLLNNYYWCNSYSSIKELIIKEAENISIDPKQFKNSIKITDIIDNQFTNDEYIFLIGFNQKSIPKSYKDEDYINDSIKTSLMENTLEKNKISRQIYSTAIKNIKNLTITLKETSLNSKYMPSTLIDDDYIKLENNSITYSKYSDEFNKIYFSNLIDNLVKFNDYNEDLDILNNTYDIDYMKYDNKFTGIKNEKIRNILEQKGYSYSNVSTYFKCPFRFYLDYFFKLQEFETTFNTFLGTAFHKVLEECITSDKDIDEIYYKEIEKNKEQIIFTEKEKYYVDKVKDELHFIVEEIKEQYKHSKHNPKLEIHERKIKKTTEELNLNTKIKTILKGVVDKCIFIDNDVIIIDYKTGTSSTIDRDYFKYGITIQLPIYLYLLKNVNNNYNIVGMYLQHILTGMMKSKNDSIKNTIKLDGLTLSNTDKISKFDDTYQKSEVIRGLGFNKDGEWKYINRMMDEKDKEDIYNTVKQLIEDCINNTSDGIYDIKPIKDDKVDGCKYCSYRDICFRKESDIEYINNFEEEGE